LLIGLGSLYDRNKLALITINPAYALRVWWGNLITVLGLPLVIRPTVQIRHYGPVTGQAQKCKTNEQLGEIKVHNTVPDTQFQEFGRRPAFEDAK